MFFNNIAEWSKKKVFWMDILFSAIYLVFMLVLPIITVITQYGLGQTQEKDTIFTGWSLIILIFVAVVGMFALIKLLRKLPDETRKQQKFKYSLELFRDLLLPVLAIIVLYQFKVNFDLAYKTIILCLISMIVGIVVDNIFLKYIDKELSFNKEIDHEGEITKRKHRMNIN